MRLGRSLLLVGGLALVALAAPVLGGRSALPVVQRPVEVEIHVLGAEVELPVGWAGARVVAADRRLDGARALTVRAGAPRALLVVRCPAADRSFQVVVADRPTRYGPCGRIVLVDPGPLAPGSALVVTARGPLPFAAAVLEQ